MKKLVLGLAIATLLLVFTPAQSETVYGANPVPTTNPAEAAASTVLINRLNEIDALDKSTMNATEKRALRKEVRTIKKELSTSGGGVYLSVGALLLIIILLIVLL